MGNYGIYIDVGYDREMYIYIYHIGMCYVCVKADILYITIFDSILC